MGDRSAGMQPHDASSVGAPLDRVDGRLKVTGSARYSAEPSLKKPPRATTTKSWPTFSSRARSAEERVVTQPAADEVALGKLPLSLSYRQWMDTACADLGLTVLPITLDHTMRQRATCFSR